VGGIQTPRFYTTRGIAEAPPDNSKIEFEESSGSVFAGPGLEDAYELHARGLMGLRVLDLLKERDLKKQKDVSTFPDIKQPEVSRLVNGEFSRFSEARLIGFLKKLDQKVAFQISPHKQGEPFRKVTCEVWNTGSK